MKHNEEIEKVESVSKILGDLFSDSEEKIKALENEYLEGGLTLNGNAWKKHQNSRLQAFKKRLGKIIHEEEKNAVKAVKNASNVLNLTGAQLVALSKRIKSGYKTLNTTAIKGHRANIVELGLKSNVADNLYNMIADKIASGQPLGFVQYKNGRNVRWENWMEMKLRTDLQQDISKNMIKEGASSGVIFYITSFYGDCAPDHADFQGKIYVDDDWMSICPKDRLEEVENYIRANKIMTVQEVSGEAGNYFTTRPNCRHYFQYISIDEVLGAKDLKEVRDKMDLNYNGKYKPEKYDALSQQRSNERYIRSYKGKIAELEQLKNNLPKNANSDKIDKQLANAKRRLAVSQANQRQLLKENKGVLHRNYDREIYGKIISDFRIKK